MVDFPDKIVVYWSELRTQQMGTGLENIGDRPSIYKYHIPLYYIILYYVILYIMLYYIILHYVILYHIIYHIILYYVIYLCVWNLWMLMAFSCGLMGFHRADLHNLQKKNGGINIHNYQLFKGEQQGTDRVLPPGSLGTPRMLPT